MVAQPAECRFYSEGYCFHSDRVCSRVCRWAVRTRDQLTFKDHFEVYWRRRERFVDLVLRWAALGFSILALLVSTAAYVAVRASGGVGTEKAATNKQGGRLAVAPSLSSPVPVDGK